MDLDIVKSLQTYAKVYTSVGSAPKSRDEGKTLFKVSGDCSVEIACPRYKSEVVGVIDQIYMKIFEDCRGDKLNKNGNSWYSTDMELLRKQKQII